MIFTRKISKELHKWKQSKNRKPLILRGARQVGKSTTVRHFGVKSGAKGRLRSLHEFMDRTDHDLAIRFLANKVSIENVTTQKGKNFQLLNLPYFLGSQLDGYLEWAKNLS